MKQYFITMLGAQGAFANVGIPLPAHAQRKRRQSWPAANAVGRVLLFGEKLS